MTKRFSVFWIHRDDPVGADPDRIKRLLSRHVSLGEARGAVKVWRRNDRAVWDIWIEDTENKGKRVR